MKTIEAHTHKFTKTGTQKIQVMKIVGNGGTPSASDIIKLRVCACGKTLAYDLERVLA